MYIQYLGEIVPPPSQNTCTVGVCNQITFVVFHYISSMLVTLLKIIDVPIQVPNIFGLIVSFKFLNFSFQICLLFVPEISASITSYIVQIICMKQCISSLQASRKFMIQLGGKSYTMWFKYNRD